MYRILFVAILSLLCSLSCSSPLSADWNTFEAFRDSITSLHLDSSHVYSVKNMVVEDGPMTCTFHEGTIVLFKPIAGRHIGATFHGRASMKYRPNLRTELVNLKRFYHADVYDEAFDHATIAFTSDAFLELLDKQPRTGAVTGDFEDAPKQWRSMMLVNEGEEVESAPTTALLNNGYYNTLYIDAQKKNDHVFLYSRDAFEDEPHKLYIMHNKNMLFVNQCPEPLEDASADSLGVAPTDQVYVKHHKIHTRIDRSLVNHATDQLTYTVIADSISWLNVVVDYRMDIDSVVDERGKKLVHYRPKNSYTCWIKLPRNEKHGEEHKISISYHGEIIVRYMDYTILTTSTGWYTAHNYKQKATFDMTFDHQESMTLVAVGQKLSSSSNDDVTTSTWKVDRPIRNCSFHIGFFKIDDIEKEKPVPSATMMYRTAEQKDFVHDHLSQSLEFFTNLYGTIPVEHLTATELPGTHGEAFPGLLHLSTYAFTLSGSASTDDFFGEQFLAHEIAHQWWGIAVDFASYRDQWLSEGFAEYSCLLYAQFASNEKNKHLRLLNEYRKKIFDYGKRTFDKDLSPAAIGLGYRVRIGDNQGDAYNTFVYYKGAWVLHMLRHMLIDWRTMNEDKFVNIMKNFYTKHKGKLASTDDFQATIEEALGTDMQWFFDQWVYGNQLPQYTFAWKKVKQPSGKWAIEYKITTEGVSPNFKMIVPIGITFDKVGTGYFSIMVEGTSKTGKSPEFTNEPDEVEFNALSSVLCQSKTTSLD